MSLLDYLYNNDAEQRRRSMERAIERQSRRTPADVEYGLLSSAVRSRTPARRGDYPEIEETLGRLRPREVDAAYEMGRQEGIKAAALSRDIPSVMQMTPAEVQRSGIEGAMAAMTDPEAYKRGVVSPVQQRASEIATAAQPFVSRAGDALQTAAGSVYTGLTDPSVVQPSAQDNVLQRALKGGVGTIQQGVGALGDLATSPLVAARDIGMYLGSSADNPYVPDYMEAISTRIDAANQRSSLEDAQASQLAEARRILAEREKSASPSDVGASAPQTEDMDSPPNGAVRQQAEKSASDAVRAAATANPSSLLGSATIDDGLLSLEPRRQQASVLGGLPSQLQDLVIAYGRQKASQPQLVTAADLDKIRPITGASLLAGASDVRAAREAAEEKKALKERELDIKEKAASLRRSGTVSQIEYNVIMRAAKKGYNSLSKVEKDIYNKVTNKPEVFRFMELGDQNADGGVRVGNYNVKRVSS